MSPTTEAPAGFKAQQSPTLPTHAGQPIDPLERQLFACLAHATRARLAARTVLPRHQAARRLPVSNSSWRKPQWPTSFFAPKLMTINSYMHIYAIPFNVRTITLLGGRPF